MKVYFAGSIRGGREDQPIYDGFIKHIQGQGVEVLCEHVGLKDLTDQGQDQPDALIYARDLGWIKESDGVIAEVTNPSHGVAVEIDRALVVYGKSVLALFANDQGRSLSPMIRGATSEFPESLTVFDYKRDDVGMKLAKLAIDNFLQNIK